MRENTSDCGLFFVIPSSPTTNHTRELFPRVPQAAQAICNREHPCVLRTQTLRYRSQRHYPSRLVIPKVVYMDPQGSMTTCKGFIPARK
ncbi:hypothetical protein TNCV_1105471 [Trichonephila clavipes]|nr:hypothetical protein TNCV_1105471 [Trichonephila clavipes]